MDKENKEIIKFAKDKLEKAKQKLYVQEIIQESIKEYEKHREVYLKNKWTYEDIGRAMAKIMITKVKPPICAVGSSETTSENSLHKNVVSGCLPKAEDVYDNCQTMHIEDFKEWYEDFGT
jgi:ribosome-binding ATPase YchF (GTP1/OBG family)